MSHFPRAEAEIRARDARISAPIPGKSDIQPFFANLGNCGCGIFQPNLHKFDIPCIQSKLSANKIHLSRGNYGVNVRYIGEMRVLGGVASSRGRVVSAAAAAAAVGSNCSGCGLMSPLLISALSCDMCRSKALPSSRVCNVHTPVQCDINISMLCT